MSEAVKQSATAPPARRWYQYSVRTLLMLPLVLALVLSAIYSWPYVHRRYVLWRLQDYVDRDLRELPEEEKAKLAALIAAFSEDALSKKNDSLHVVPNVIESCWLHIAPIPGSGRAVMLATIHQGFDSNVCRVYVWNPSGHLLDRTERRVHNGSHSNAAEPLITSAVFDDSRYGFLCLVLASANPVMRQYYLVTEDHLEKLRKEDANGKCMMADDVIEWSPEAEVDWQHGLGSSERIAQLRGLAMFFAGGYLQGEIPKVRQRLSELAASPDPWISEEAKLALEEAKVK